MLHLRFSEFPFLTAAFLHELRPQALPDGVQVRFFLEFVYFLFLEFMKAPGPRRDGNGGSAPVASPSWGAIYQMLSLSFLYSDSQLPDIAHGCRVSFKSRWGSLLRSVLRRGGHSPRYRRRKCRSAKPNRPAKASGVGVRPPKGTMPNHVSCKATTTLSHWLTVGIGSDEVSPKATRGLHWHGTWSSSRVLCSLDRLDPLANEGVRHVCLMT